MDYCIRLYIIMAAMKTKPIPTRFEPLETQYIARMSKMTGLSASEIVRRSVRLLKRQVKTPRDCHIIIGLV